MKLKIISIIILLVTQISGVFGKKKTTINFEVNFHYKNKTLPDSLLIISYPNAKYWENSIDSFVKRYHVNKFVFRLNESNIPLLFKIGIVDHTTRDLLISDLGCYYAEAGDNIKVDIYETFARDSIIFSGVGSAKYTLVEKLNKDYRDFDKYFKPFELGKSPKDLKEYIDTYTSNVFLGQANKDMLVFNAEGVNKNIKDLINYQFANYDVYWSGVLFFTYSKFKNDELMKNTVVERFNYYYNKLLDSSNDNSVLSPEHYLNLISLIQIKLAMNNTNGLADIKSYYSALKTYSNSAIVKERILSQFLMSSNSLYYVDKFNQAVYDSLAMDASKFLISDEGKKIIDLKLKFLVGSNFYDSDFIDLNNNKFSTKSLRGKVFIIDLWGIGCEGCAQFHKMFDKDIWPLIKNKSSFKFLSVNVDNSKERWISGLKTSKYTIMEYLNVYTGEGVGTKNHAFTKHYNINAIPFLMLVNKEGKILSKFDNGLDSESLYKLIIQGLNSYSIPN